MNCERYWYGKMRSASPRRAFWSARFILLTLVLLITPHDAAAAQRQFFVFQAPPSETVPAGLATNFVVTLTYSNASGTINNAIFTNGTSVTPSGQGVTVSLASSSPAVPDNGGTASLFISISAAASVPANTAFQVVVGATNASFTANVPPGIVVLTNQFMVGAPAYSNGFTIALSPEGASCLAGTSTNFASTVALVDRSLTISGIITNGVAVTGPDPADVIASLNSPYAPITNNFDQTNLTLSISVNSNATPGAYSITVSGTNSAFSADPGPGIVSVTYNLTLTTHSEFILGLAQPAETITGGAPSVLQASVLLTNLSTILTGAIINGVTVSGPYPGNVSAGINPIVLSPTSGGGTAALTLSITNTGATSLPGVYDVIVGATNANFVDNYPVPGIALITNFLTVKAPPLSIRSFHMSGMNLSLNGSGTGPNETFTVYSSTNLVLPLAQWMPVVTNLAGVDGNFDALIALAGTGNPDAAAQFFTVASVAQTNQVAAPVFSPAAGPFFAPTPVSITSATSNALIRYTTDGTTPSESNGALYTGPVTMMGPVNTNRSGFVTNASGVTMLKAIAYRGGLADSAVWTGMYEILDAVAYPPAAAPSPVVGVAHLAYNVSSTNWASILSLWTNYYGFAPLVLSNNFALIKINDQQYIELYEVPFLVSNQWQQVNMGFEVTDAEIYREHLSAAGVVVPPAVATNALGNLSFLSVDPDGHTNEWVQYLSNSVTGRSQGQYMPGTIVAGFANDLGVWTTDETLAAPRNYYVNQCGFTGSGNQVYFPNGGKRYIELLTTGPSGPTEAVSGKHGKIQFLNFRGMDLFQTLGTLTNRNTGIPVNVSVEGSSNSILHYATDVYDADLSRIRLNDE
jgi:hypothetical protein